MVITVFFERADRSSLKWWLGVSRWLNRWTYYYTATCCLDCNCNKLILICKINYMRQRWDLILGYYQVLFGVTFQLFVPNWKIFGYFFGYCLVLCLSVVAAVVSSVITVGWIGSHFLPEEQNDAQIRALLPHHYILLHQAKMSGLTGAVWWLWKCDCDSCLSHSGYFTISFYKRKCA